MAYGALTSAPSYGSGPEDATDNGDGTFTFQFADGRQPLTAAGPIAKQKFEEVQQRAPYDINPDIVESAKPGEDLRTAQMGPMGLGGAGGVGRPPASLADAGAQGEASRAEVMTPEPPTRQGIGGGYNDVPHPPPGTPGMATGGADARLLPGQAPQEVDPSKLSFGAGGMGGFGAAPMMYRPGTKGGWSPSSKVERPGYQASEGVQTARQAAQGLETDAAESQYQAQQQKTQYEVMAAAQRADAVGQQLAEDSARMTSQQNQVTAKLSELDRLGEDVSKEKIDPDKFFKDQGAVGTIGMALAAAAGGFAQGLTGAPNAALDTINRMVDRDISGQRANLEHKKEMLGAKRLGVKDLQASFQSANEQEAARRALAWRTVDAQLDAQKAKLGAAFDDAAYGQMKSAIAEKRAASMAAFEKEARTETQISSRYAPPQAGGLVMAPPDDIDPKAVAQLPNGQHVAFATEKSADAFKESASDVGKFKSMISRAKALRADPSSFNPKDPKYGERQQLESSIILSAPKTLEGLARFTEEEKEMKSAGMHWFNKQGALDSLDAQADEKLQQAAHGHGGRPVQATPYRKTPQSGVSLGYRYKSFEPVPAAPPPMQQRGE